MNYIQVNNISKSYGFDTLFEYISFTINKGDKVALIARNGTGKSTILKIIAEVESADTGQIVKRQDLVCHFLSQHVDLQEDKSILENVFTQKNAITEAIINYEKALVGYQKKINTDTEKTFNNAVATMDALQAWEYETEAKSILGEFGIHDLDQLVGQLSGGQKKKIALAHALIGKPDVLLLDEPTNHLDIDMIEWLENYLNGSNITMLAVTHDRYFLDNVCNTIIEIDRNTLFEYKGNYSYYLEKKAEYEYTENLAVEKATNLFRTELEWIRRMPKARTTKSKARIESFDELKEKASKTYQQKDIVLDVNSQYLGNKILEINNITKSYDDKIIVNNFSFTFQKGEKVGVVGLNGCGKSTLLNLIYGNINPDMGRIVKGQTVVMGYYTQENVSYTENKKVIDIVKEKAEIVYTPKGSITASQFLHRFNFEYPLQNAFYCNLSGGEKRRFNLMMQLIHNPNFLLLDEPTNDLDIYTLQILEDFLIQFEGCLLIVSHDRFLLDKVCSHIFVFEENGNIKDHYGNYTEYYIKHIHNQRNKNRVEKASKPKNDNKTQNKEVQKKPTYKQQKELERLENLLEELETQKNEVLELLNSQENSSEEIQQYSEQYANLEKEIEKAFSQWIELSESIGDL